MILSTLMATGKVAYATVLAERMIKKLAVFLGEN